MSSSSKTQTTKPAPTAGSSSTGEKQQELDGKQAQQKPTSGPVSAQTLTVDEAKELEGEKDEEVNPEEASKRLEQELKKAEQRRAVDEVKATLRARKEERKLRKVAAQARLAEAKDKAEKAKQEAERAEQEFKDTEKEIDQQMKEQGAAEE